MTREYCITSYDYELPAELIAQTPEDRRDASRLLVLDCCRETIAHRRFTELPALLRPGDLLVVNDTRVFAARLLGRKQTGGKVEMLLLHFPKSDPAPEKGWYTATATVLLKSSRRPQPGSLLHFTDELSCRVKELLPHGKARVKLYYTLGPHPDLETLLAAIGHIPLPPYIARPQGTTPEDLYRYQTRYAVHTGAVAAPTAGLHFSDRLLASIEGQGVEIAAITLHVGYGTFAPVRCEDIRDHDIHAEDVLISQQTAARVNRAKAEGRRIWAVGTTTVRALEAFADSRGKITAGQSRCDLYIYPGFQFRIVENLITNFHLPRSSLLFLVSALAGRSRINRCYREAIARRYRFFSYGDAMAIVTRA